MKTKLFFSLIFILPLYSLEEPRGIKRKAVDLMTLSEQEQIERAQHATQELIILIQNYNDLNDIETFNRIKQLLEYGADPNAKDSNNQSLLLVATRKRQKELVESLLNYGANADIQDDNLNAPLLEASRHNLADIVRLLLSFGANPNIKNNKGDTPLRMALVPKKIQVIQLLLQAGADPNIPNNKGKSTYSLLTFLIARAQQQNKETEVASLLDIKKWIEHPETLPKLGIHKIR